MFSTIRLSDITACTCTVISGSPNVFVDGLKRGRASDRVIGHGDWIANAIKTGSSTVFDNGLAGTRVTDVHTGHPKRDGSEFHQTAYLIGSLLHFTD